MKRSIPLDERHRGEYAYHIVRNLIHNGLKLIYDENQLYSQAKLEDGLDIIMDGKTTAHLNKFKQLLKLKKNEAKSIQNGH